MRPIEHAGISNYLISPGDHEKHLIPISQIVADAFANGEHVDEISKSYIGNCHYDFDVTRLIWEGEKLVHHWGVWGYPMRMGSIQLKVAGIGAVITIEEHRKRGLMFQAASESFKAMKDNGYDLTILRGRHYHKFGYRRAWNYVTTRLKPEEIPETTLQLPYEELGPEHMAQINQLYNREYANFSGSAVRPTYSMLKTGDMNAKGWFDSEGNLNGYVRAAPTEDKKTLQCLEAAGDPTQALAVLGELFKQGKFDDLTFFTFPEHHPLVQVVRRGSCVVENRYFYHTGWQVKVINLTSTLTKMLPLFKERLQQSQFKDCSGNLLLEGDQQSAALLIENGAIRVSEAAPGEHAVTAGAALGRLLIGSEEPDEVIRDEEIECRGLGMELVARTVPQHVPNDEPLRRILKQWYDLSGFQKPDRSKKFEIRLTDRECNDLPSFSFIIQNYHD